MFKEGNEELLHIVTGRKRIGIIGPRDSTIKERMDALKLAESIVYRGDIVVSGLAHGIDTFAHIGGRNRTIAVVNNLRKIYPKENTKMAACILSNNGLIISPYNSQEDIGVKSFLERDRMLVDICDEIYAIAGELSAGAENTIMGGTGYTIKYAKQTGKKVILKK